MADEGRLYQLNGVVHVASGINKEYYTVHFTWFYERFRVLSADASEETMCIYACAYIMMLLSTQLFGDKSGIRWLPFVARLDHMGSYSWSSAALVWLYRCMCRVANRNSWIFWRFPTLRPYGFDDFFVSVGIMVSINTLSILFFVTNIDVILLSSRWATYLPMSDGKEQRMIQYRLALNRLGGHDEPYALLDVLAVIHPKILTKENNQLWWAVTSLIYFSVIEWHQVDMVFPQLGSDGRGGDRWFPSYYQTRHEHWDQRVSSMLSIQRVADLGPLAEYLDWILSLEKAFADPRPVEIPEDTVPMRIPMSDLPNNRCLERRRRIGTWATDRE
ncbi:hypothetical protein Ahy_A10g048815 [Arachis hypogaea]|uniref:Aminotransferase-like plant mobile domain-containing protein n=1 Tax=Arachis hypogaea TaxID=3818 RepID=A0A445B603_ARAHY|nr:hypothetical protein Ahy_A10g048815 [Arachis hypogaea]